MPAALAQPVHQHVADATVMHEVRGSLYVTAQAATAIQLVEYLQVGLLQRPLFPGVAIAAQFLSGTDELTEAGIADDVPCDQGLVLLVKQLAAGCQATCLFQHAQINGHAMRERCQVAGCLQLLGLACVLRDVRSLAGGVPIPNKEARY